MNSAKGIFWVKKETCPGLPIYPTGGDAIPLWDERLMWRAQIFGSCQSKANSRRLVLNRKTRKPMFIKSKPAHQFERDFILQTKHQAPFVPITDDLEITCRIYYRTRRNDLDESLVLDCLQRAGIIQNDRQIRRKIIEGFVDKNKPRVEIELRRY